jgi:glycosyltransferase involved in cell wall biosynthesis
MTPVKISVVMGVYNAGPELRDTIDSILAQTECDFELIVVDDGSTRGDAAMLDECAARDPRVRVLRREHNLGLTRSLIEGCAVARGTYIARHDAGDLSLPTRFEEQARLLDAGATFVSCATEYVGPALEPLWTATPSGATASAPAFVLQPDRDPPLLDGPTHHGSVMFRRDAYERCGGYRAAFYYGQDFDLWFRLAVIGTFHAIPRVLYRARITPESISSGAREEQEQLAALSSAAMRARHHGQSESELLASAAAIGRSRAEADPARGLYFIGEALRRNGDPRARHYLRRAIAAKPLSVRAWLRLLQSAMLAR